MAIVRSTAEGPAPLTRATAKADPREQTVLVLVFGMETEDLDTDLLLRLLGRIESGESDGEPAADLSGPWEGAFIASSGEEQTSLSATASLAQSGTTIAGIAAIEDDEEPGRRRTYVFVPAAVIGDAVAGVLQWVQRPDVLVGLAGTVCGATIEGRWYDNDERGPFAGSFVLSRRQPTTR